jgi:hypothetical protein
MSLPASMVRGAPVRWMSEVSSITVGPAALLIAFLSSVSVDTGTAAAVNMPADIAENINTKIREKTKKSLRE